MAKWLDPATLALISLLHTPRPRQKAIVSKLYPYYMGKEAFEVSSYIEVATLKQVIVSADVEPESLACSSAIILAELKQPLVNVTLNESLSASTEIVYARYTNVNADVGTDLIGASSEIVVAYSPSVFYGNYDLEVLETSSEIILAGYV